ncbi:hypothetical protein CPB84DRAFT_1782585 [Gymnopilus junonius]|uniref:Shelterin complex subunit TPP1/Est3 domain-containing protein n=1 Tax=Gymnopilus junonius TaxID=109634 RepID=A0A9P5TKV6_GYMJU|nr:hypothetical protein CPB84DRAFT_1782585 [Gymnopilus junonius]
MADSLLPWMREYLTSLLRAHNTNIFNAPIFTRKKKVQITKFLTYGTPQDTEIWAEVSDKQNLIPIKFTPEAISYFREIHVGQRLTQHRGAIAAIQNFKLISTPIPLPSGQATQPSLVFECSSVSILGSSGEATFGNPLPVGSFLDIASWCKSPNCTGETNQSHYRERSGIQSPSKMQGDMHSEIVSMKESRETASSSKDIGANLPDVQIPLSKSGTHDLKSYIATWQLVTKSRKFDMKSSTSVCQPISPRSIDHPVSTDRSLQTEAKLAEEKDRSGNSQLLAIH